jgi:O-antigen ligase
MIRHRSTLLLVAAGLAVPVLLAPLLADGQSSLALALAAVSGSLAWISPALPVGLEGVPAVVVSLTGTNPLPAGGTVTLLALWALLGVVFAVVRRPGTYPLALFFGAPIALSFVLAVLMLLRLGASPAGAYGSSKLQLFVLVNLTGLVAGAVVGRRRRDFDLFVIVLFAVAVLASIALLQKIVNGSAQEVFAGRQSLSAGFNPILLARSLSEGALLSVYFLADRYASLALRVVAVALLPVFAVTIIATGSRGPLLALIAGLVVLFVLVLRQGRGLRPIALFLCGLVASVVVVPRVLSTPGAIDRALSIFTDKGTGLSSNGRDALWSQATGLIEAHPLLGIGTGGFAQLEPIEKYPHNIVLEVGAELGMVGLVLLVAIIVSALVYLARAWSLGEEQERTHVALASALLAMAVVDANFSGDITSNSRIWFFAGLATGIAWRATARREEQAVPPLAGGAPARRREPFTP